jgi:hypothetical protein
MAASLGVTTPFTRIGYRPLYLIAEFLLLLLLLTGLLNWHRDRRPRWAYGFALLLFVGAGLMSACGTGSSGNVGNLGTPAGTYSLVVSATFTSGSTSITHNVKLNLVVK